MSYKQFCVYQWQQQWVLILSNTVFHDIDQVLCAAVYPGPVTSIIKRLQIPFSLQTQTYYIDLLDILTISKANLDKAQIADLNDLHHEIKSGLDLLIDGF